MARVARMLANVPVSSTGTASSACAKAVPACNSATSVPMPSRLMGLGRNHRAGLDQALVLLCLGFRKQLSFPFRHCRARYGIADGVGGGATHIEEHVHALDEQQAGFRDVELVERCGDDDERGTRHP